jgi:hypothetical protein
VELGQGFDDCDLRFDRDAVVGDFSENMSFADAFAVSPISAIYSPVREMNSPINVQWLGASLKRNGASYAASASGFTSPLASLVS